jgi:hypothetical protein
MKEQKKSRKDQSEQYEDDDTLDIIEALDQMEQTGKMSTNETPEDENMIELTLDDEDLVFDELDNNGEFHFDESMAAGLGEEFSDNAGEVEMGQGDVHADFGDDSFSLDLSEEDNDSDLDLSFDGDVHFELDETPVVDETEASEELAFNLDDQAGDLEFDLDLPSSEPPEMTPQPDVEEEEIDVMQPEEEKVVAPDHEEPMLDLDEDDSVLGFSGTEADQESDLSSGMDLGDFDLHLDAEDTFAKTPSEPEAEDEAAVVDEEEGWDVIRPEEEAEGTTEEDAFGDELGLDDTFDRDTDEADSHRTEMESEQVADEFPGTSRISVDGEEVVDLGDETEFDQYDQYEDHDELEMSDEAEGFTGIEHDMGVLVDHAIAGMPEEAEEDEDEFDVSIEDFDIDLEEEAAKEMFESPAEAEAQEEAGFEEASESVSESELDVNADVGQFGGEGESSEPIEPAEMLADHPQMEAQDETSQPSEEQPPEAEPKEQPDTIAEPSAEVVEETGSPAEPELNICEELGLDLRLDDTRIDDFENRVTEAQTLQNYIAELDDHKPEINERIYEKLKEEYRSRKMAIFQESEFVSMQADVEHDLQDMVAKRDEFANTVSSLKDALEEVKVRHLVGEYTDTMLREKEEAQKAEITQWQEKTDKIEHVITRYRELLEAERELNPLQQTAAPEEPAAAELSPSELVQESPAAEMPTAGTPPVSEPIEQEAETEEAEPEAPESEPEDVLVSDENLVGEEPGEMRGDEADMVGKGVDEWEVSDEDLEMPTDSWMDQEFVEADSEADFSDLMVGGDEFELDQFMSDEDTANIQDAEEEEEMIACKKCGRQTPAAEKFCVNCGAKAR